MMKYEFEGHEVGTGNSVVPAEGFVKVAHGANDGLFDVTGETVATVQASLADAFNIPAEAFAYVNGKIVGEEFRLRMKNAVVFALPWGMKGGTPKHSASSPTSIKTPFPYIGGKARVAPEVWRRFGDVKNYVEPFFGGGGVLLNRPMWGGNRIETVNDLDSLLVNFWRSVKLHPRKLAKAADHPISELELHARHTWLVRQKHEVAEQIRSQEAWCDPWVAAWWVWGISQWISGGWCAPGKQSRRMPNSDDRGIHRISFRQGGQRRAEYLRGYFSQLACRLEHVRIMSGDLKLPRNAANGGGDLGVFDERSKLAVFCHCRDDGHQVTFSGAVVADRQDALIIGRLIKLEVREDESRQPFRHLVGNDERGNKLLRLFDLVGMAQLYDRLNGVELE